MFAYGQARRKQIKKTLEEFRVLDRYTLEREFFPSRIRSQVVLTDMVKAGHIKRARKHSYIYFLDRLPKTWRHTLEVNRFHFHLKWSLPSWLTLEASFEVPYGKGRSDILCIIRNKVTGGGLKFWVEVDRGTNKFDKVDLHQAYYYSGSWTFHRWACLSPGEPSYPPVIVYTTREKEIALCLKNKAPEVPFHLVTPEEITDKLYDIILRKLKDPG